MNDRLPGSRSRWLMPVLASALLAAAPGIALAQKEAAPAAATTAESFTPYSGQAGKDVIWVPTPDAIVEALLDLASVKAGDVVVDLGSGDGKIAIAAARRGANARGIEYNPDMVSLSQRNAARAGVTNVRFIQGDIFASDFSDADVVTMYLLPTLNERLRPTLLAMKPGTRVASHQFTMGDWEPDESRQLNGRDALFWVVPAKVGGTWQVDGVAGPGPLRIALKQTYQKLAGSAAWGGAAAALTEPKLAGGQIRFTVADPAGKAWRFDGNADHGGRMSGTATGPDGRAFPFTANRTGTSDSL